MKPLFLFVLLTCCVFVPSITFVSQAEEQDSAQESAQDNTETTKNTNKAPENTPAESSSSNDAKQRDILPPVSLIQQYRSDIERSISKDLLKPMLAGTEDFLTITQPDSHQTDRGVAILLPEWGQAATDPKAINFLRQHLPTQGWTTITLQPLAKPSPYPVHSDRLETEQEENKKLIDEYQDKLATMMTAVMEKAAEYPGIFLAVAQGSNAAMLLDLYQQGKVEKPNAMVMLSAYLPTEADNKALANKMATSDIPTLDLVLRRDVLWVEHIANTRKMTAQKTMKTYYRQRQLNNINAGYYPLDALAKEIKGWLTTIGW